MAKISKTALHQLLNLDKKYESYGAIDATTGKLNWFKVSTTKDAVPYVYNTDSNVYIFHTHPKSGKVFRPPSAEDLVTLLVRSYIIGKPTTELIMEGDDAYILRASLEKFAEFKTYLDPRMGAGASNKRIKKYEEYTSPKGADTTNETKVSEEYTTSVLQEGMFDEKMASDIKKWREHIQNIFTSDTITKYGGKTVDFYKKSIAGEYLKLGFGVKFVPDLLGYIKKKKAQKK